MKDLFGHPVGKGSRVHYRGSDYFYESRDTQNCYLYSSRSDVGSVRKSVMIVRKVSVNKATATERAYRLGVKARSSSATNALRRRVDRVAYEPKYFQEFEDTKADCVSELTRRMNKKVGNTCEVDITETHVTFTFKEGTTYKRRYMKCRLQEQQRFWHMCFPRAESCAIMLLK